MTYGIVLSRFNEEVTRPLLQECLRGFRERGIEPIVVEVPGAVEIPLAVQSFIQKEKPLAVVALGCVIKGDTDHYDAVCSMCGQGIMEVMLRMQTPVVFEVLMVDTFEKAHARIEKGYSAAQVAMEMAELTRKTGR